MTLTIRRICNVSSGCKAAAILDGDEDAQPHQGAVLRAILDGANECMGLFDDRPPGERWCDTTLRLLDLASFARELGTD